MHRLVVLALSLQLFAYISYGGASEQPSAKTECICGNAIQEAYPESYANAACPYKLYATTSLSPNTDSILYYLNSHSGEAFEIGTIMTSGGMTIRRATSLDFSPEGVLYGIGVGTQSPYSDKSILFTLDCQTAIATVVGDIGISQGMGRAITDMSFDQYGELYIYHKNSPSGQPSQDQVGVVDVGTAAYTKIGNTDLGEDGNGLSFAHFPTYPSQPLFHVGIANENSIDTSTGLGTVITPLIFTDPANNRPRINGLEADFLTGKMYASINDKASGSGSPNENYIGTLDLDTGVASFIKVPPTQAIDGIDSLAFNRPYEECDIGTTIPSGCYCNSDCNLAEDSCDDFIDNDFDGLTDCDDPDCDTLSCQDPDLCILGSTCSAGLCSGGTTLDCDDGEDCTDDSCNASTGNCINVNNDANSCTDGNDCTADSCVSGSCSSVNETNGTTCDDLDVCTDPDTCQSGVCQGASLVGCEPEICNDGIDNDLDGNTDCADAGDCPLTTPCQDDGNTCTTDLCALIILTRTCVHTPIVTAISCDDGNPCTDNDTCSLIITGTCEGDNNNSLPCDDGDVCTDNACSSGSCIVSGFNTASCSDGNACTTGDVCSSGTCAGTSIDCTNANECDNDACVGGFCQHTAVSNGTACSSDGNDCTDDTCQSGTCTHVNDDSNSCSDGLTCTSGDACSSGTCSGTPDAEICDNSIDDDCDFEIDFDDPDCASSTLRIFVSSDTYQGDLGGLSGADSICQGLADSASLGGLWIALLASSSNSLSSRVINCNDLPWYLVTGVPNKVANDKASLLNGSIQQAINVDEHGNNVSSSQPWSGSDGSGAPQPDNCDDWTAQQGNRNGKNGNTTKTNGKWISDTKQKCNKFHRLYCIENDSTC